MSITEKDISAAKDAIGRFETEDLLRDPNWGEPIIKIATTCIQKDEKDWEENDQERDTFQICVTREDFLDLDPEVKNLLSQAAGVGVFDLAYFDSATNTILSIVHWYMPPTDPDNEPDPECNGEVIIVEVSPDGISIDNGTQHHYRPLKLLAEFTNGINCHPSKADLLKVYNFEDYEEEYRPSPVKAYLWRRHK